MFLPQRRLRDFQLPTNENSGFFIAFIPVDEKTTSTVIDHSSNLIAQGYSYDPDSDSWQIWLGTVIRTYRRYHHA